MLGAAEVQVLQSYCNRGQETADLLRLVATAAKSKLVREPCAPVLPGVHTPKKMKKALNQQIVDAYLEGMDVTPLSKKFGVATSTIRRALDRFGVQRRQIGLSHEKIDQILELRALGWTQKKIADWVRCAGGTVFNVMHRAKP